MAQTTNLPIAGYIPVASLNTSCVAKQADATPRALDAPTPIPVPRRRALETMQSLGSAIGADIVSVCFVGEKEVVGYRQPSAGLTMLATACYRPMLCEQAQELRSSNDEHVLIVRLEDETHGYGPFTVDLLMADTQTWLIRYRLWQIHPTGDLWLVPSEGEGRSIRIVGGYLALSPRAPFYNLFEREHGFNVAAKTFAALQGAN